MGEKVILDTDIGTDVDDAWALSLCLASSEIDLLGVTLVHANLDTRGKIALKMLKLANRLDVPVYRGLSNPITPGASVYWGGHEGKGTDFSDVAGLSAQDGAVDFILDTVRRNPGEVVLCSIGPMTNVGEAIRRDLDTMQQLKKLTIMGATFVDYGPGAASREHNACVDPVATKTVLESGIPATVVGLNVTMQVCIHREDVKPLRHISRGKAMAGETSSLACQTEENAPADGKTLSTSSTPSRADCAFGDYLADMTYQYFNVVRRDVLYMHDPLAVATIIDPSLVKTSRMSAEVMEDGRVAWKMGGCLDVCTEVDAQRFVKFLLNRVYSLVV